jgi:RNA polymerase sigma factor (TIGR02999 family)
MSDVTRILSAVAQGNPQAAEQLLAIVYGELRQLAIQKLSHEKVRQTFNPTALVHEAYLRLFGKSATPHWECREHFFASAAEAMRRILIDNARRKKRVRHGGDREQVDLLDQHLVDVQKSGDELLALDEALTNLETQDPAAAHLVKLRFFSGLSIEQVGRLLGFSRATAYRQWNYARAWLRCEIQGKCGSAGH